MTPTISSRATDAEVNAACIRHSRADDKSVWCGKTAHGWYFTDLDHAAYNGLDGGRIIACRQCVDAATKSLLRAAGVDVRE